MIDPSSFFKAAQTPSQSFRLVDKSGRLALRELDRLARILDSFLPEPT
jgi:hypothetical protein